MKILVISLLDLYQREILPNLLHMNLDLQLINEYFYALILELNFPVGINKLFLNWIEFAATVMFNDDP